MKRLIALIVLTILFIIPAAQAVSIGGGLNAGQESADEASRQENVPLIYDIGSGLGLTPHASIDDWYCSTALSLANDAWEMATDPHYLRYHLQEVLDEMYAQVDILAGISKVFPDRIFRLDGMSRSEMLRMSAIEVFDLSGEALEKHLNLRMQDIRRTGFMEQEYVMQGISVYSEAITYYVLPDDFRPQMIVLDYGEAIVTVQFIELENGVGMAAATLTVPGSSAIDDIMAEMVVPGVYSEPVEIAAN